MDLLITGGTVVTWDGPGFNYVDAAIAIDQSRIVGMGDPGDLTASFGGPGEKLDADGCLVIPGIVNAHTHLLQSAFRGLGDGLRLKEWHERVMTPLYRAIRHEDAYWFTLVGALENIRSGVTTVVNFQAWPNDFEACDDVARAVGGVGLRGQLVKAFGGIQYDGGHLPDHDALVASAVDVFVRLHGTFDGRIRFAVGPSRPSNASSVLIRSIYEVARAYGSGVHTHIAETAASAAAACEALGMSEIQYLDASGTVDDRMQAAHCVALPADDIGILAKRGATPVHCPVSNMYLADGVADLPAFDRAGINVALGSDGAASNNNQDMFTVMKATSLLQKVVRGDPSLFPAPQVLRMATLHGARSCGLNAGSIEVGRLADLAIVDLQGIHNQPVHDPLSALVYSAHCDDVRSVVVAGRVIMRDRRITSVDEGMVIAEAQSRARRLVAAAGLT